MIHINEAVIVEGKYDKIKLSSIIDAVIIETGGFSVFNDREKMELIRKMADKKGVLIITDSDEAGFKIRNYLRGALPKEKVKHVYIPDIYGKEHRKTIASKEGKLGVEGIPKDILLKSFERAGVICSEVKELARQITKLDLYEDGLTGSEGSNHRKHQLLQNLGLPERLSTNMLVSVLNAMMTYEDYKREIVKI